MSSNTYTLACNSKLTEDYIHSTSMLASSSALTPLATFINSQSESEALLIHEDGELCHLQREPLSSSGWSIYGFGAQLDGIAAANGGSVWVTANNGSVLQSNAGHWNTITAPAVSDLSISVGQDGTVYGVGPVQAGSFHLFVFDPVAGQFNDTGVVPISTAPVGNPGALWAIDNAGQVWTNSTGTWEANAQWPSMNAAAVEVQVGTDGSVWVLGQDGLLYSWTLVNAPIGPSSWNWSCLEDVPTGITSIAPVSTGQVYVMAGTTIQVFNSGSWSSLPVPQYEITSVSAGTDGTLWALGTYDSAWSFDGTSWNRQMMPTDLAGFTSGLQVTEVVTGRHSDGVQYAFYVMSGSLYVSSLDESKAFGGYWNGGVQLLTGPCSNFAVTYTPNGDLIAFGVSSGSLVVIQSSGGGTWQSCSPLGEEYSGTVQLMNSSGSSDGWRVCSLTSGELSCFSATIEPYQVILGPEFPQMAGQSLQTLVPFPAAAGVLCTCALDTLGQLWLIDATDPSQPNYFQLSGALVSSPIGSIQSAAVIMSDDSDGRIFARDENNLLWILRLP